MRQLTDSAVRNAKPRAKPYKLTEAGGLYPARDASRRKVLAPGLPLPRQAPHACPWRLSLRHTKRRSERIHPRTRQDGEAELADVYPATRHSVL